LKPDKNMAKAGSVRSEVEKTAVMKAKSVKSNLMKKAKTARKWRGGVPKAQRKVKGAEGERITAQRSERGKGLKFQCSTFQTVSQFQPGSKIKYGPNPKSAGSLSFARYAGYSKAKTVGEALKLGSKLADLCWELERKQFTVLGGVLSESAERAAIGDKWFDKAQKMLTCFNGPRGINVNLNDPRAAQVLAKEEAWRTDKLKRVAELSKKYNIKVENEAELSKMGIHEAQELHAERKVCDSMCAMRLKDAAKAGRKTTDAELKEAMSLWGFSQNVGRLNVMRPGIKYVYSDTIGAIRKRCTGYGITAATRHYPNFVRLLCKWLTDSKLEDKLGCDFKCTAINLNANYAGARHRDGNNEGPSVIRAVGDFTGGALMYWPKDVKVTPRCEVEQLDKKDCVTFDLAKDTTIFDGCRAHEVQDFTGNRYSIVFFSASGYQKVPEKDVKYLKSIGMPYPAAKAMEELKKATKKLVEGKTYGSLRKVKKSGLKK